MSTTDPVHGRPTVSQYEGDIPEEYRYHDPSAGYGWVLFAGSMLLMLATLNAIDGIAAVSNSKFFTQNATYVISDLNTYGWVLIVTALIQAATGIAIMARVKGVRWVGVAIAGFNGVVQLMFIPAYPFWSLALFALDVLVIYGLVAHGHRSRR
ncbi:MAG TPA: hypothetical protein VH418_07570 [Solirubrobacteraceae bacterium]